MNKFYLQWIVLLTLLLLVPTFVCAQQTPSLTQAVINYSTSGDHTLIAGVAGQRVRIYRIYLFCNAANNIILKDTSATLSPVMNLAASQGFVLDLATEPWFITTPGSGFIINMSAAQQCSGRAYYRIN